MKKPFKKAVRAQIDAISLDERQLDKLMQIQCELSIDDAPNKNTKTHLAAGNKPWYVAVAAMVMVLVLGTVVVMQYYQNVPSDVLIQKIANEVAGNHLAMKPMEVQTVAINDLQSYFTKLDFLAQPSKLIDRNDNMILVGGRYCSIQGSTAAQLRYKDEQGGFVTLFETHYSPELQNFGLFKELPDINKGEEPIVTYAKGIKVTLWQERGLLMVSTEKPE